MRLPQTLDTANPYNERARSFAMPGNSFVLLGWPILKECRKKSFRTPHCAVLKEFFFAFLQNLELNAPKENAGVWEGIGL